MLALANTPSTLPNSRLSLRTQHPSATLLLHWDEGVAMAMHWWPAWRGNLPRPSMPDLGFQRPAMPLIAPSPAPSLKGVTNNGDKLLLSPSRLVYSMCQKRSCLHHRCFGCQSHGWTITLCNTLVSLFGCRNAVIWEYQDFWTDDLCWRTSLLSRISHCWLFDPHVEEFSVLNRTVRSSYLLTSSITLILGENIICSVSSLFFKLKLAS